MSSKLWCHFLNTPGKTNLNSEETESDFQSVYLHLLASTVQSLAGLLNGSFYLWKWEHDDSAMLFSMLHPSFGEISPELDVS